MFTGKLGKFLEMEIEKIEKFIPAGDFSVIEIKEFDDHILVYYSVDRNGSFYHKSEKILIEDLKNNLELRK